MASAFSFCFSFVCQSSFSSLFLRQPFLWLLFIFWKKVVIWVAQNITCSVFWVFFEKKKYLLLKPKFYTSTFLREENKQYLAIQSNFSQVLHFEEEKCDILLLFFSSNVMLFKKKHQNKIPSKKEKNGLLLNFNVCPKQKHMFTEAVGFFVLQSSMIVLLWLKYSLFLKSNLLCLQWVNFKGDPHLG